MSGGPIFYDLITGKPEFNALMAHLGSAMHDYGELRRMAWSAHLGQIPTHGFAISAFPSLHVAMATLLALQAYHAGRRWFYAALALVAVILLGSVQLGWHYAVDGYFSIAATLLVWRAVGWALRRTARTCASCAARPTSPSRPGGRPRDRAPSRGRSPPPRAS